jgi:hypothetical protein
VRDVSQIPEGKRKTLQPGHKAMEHARNVLAQRPHKDDHELTTATQCLADFRRELIVAQHKQGSQLKDGECLSRLNAIISVTMGMHFPLGNPPWEEFEKVLGWLDVLVDDVEGRLPA